jgi:hypothetical protein
MNLTRNQGSCVSTGCFFHLYTILPITVLYHRHIDPLDILVICSIDVFAMSIIEAKVIGVMEMIDSEERDDKIIAVAKNDMSVNYLNDISDLPPHTLVELKRFFEDYKQLEHKDVIVDQFLGREKAYEIITEGIKLYEINKDKRALNYPDRNLVIIIRCRQNFIFNIIRFHPFRKCLEFVHRYVELIKDYNVVLCKVWGNACQNI